MQKREIELQDGLRFFQILPKRPKPCFARDLSISGCNIFLLLTYKRMIQEAKQAAMSKLQQKAQLLGANAIVDIDLDFETVGGIGSMLMVVASGTAVRV